MTAPDPGLTDLIAAHQFDPVGRICSCGVMCGVVCDNLTYPSHVASVVEQHTNGRTAELEASTRESVRVLVMERHRAEKAEAAIARVEKLAHDMRGWCSPHGISVTYSDRIRAALEGPPNADPT